MTQVTAKWNIPSKWYFMIEDLEGKTGREAFEFQRKRNSDFKPKFGCGMFRDQVEFNMEWQKGTELKYTVSQRRGYKVLEFSFA